MPEIEFVESVSSVAADWHRSESARAPGLRAATVVIRLRRMRPRHYPGFVFLFALMNAMPAATFGDDLAFLKSHTSVVVLTDATNQGQVVVVPAWQGRVMTSTARGAAGASYGWVNRELIAARKLQPHINVF